MAESIFNDARLDTLRELAAAAYSPGPGCVYSASSVRERRPNVWFCGRMMNSARAVWMLRHGDPGELQVLHRCNNGDAGCIGIACLYLGDQSRNMQDAVAAGTLRSGARCNLAKLTDQQVADIRARYVPWQKGSALALAAEYGVSRQTVNRIANGQTYRPVAHVERKR